MILRVVAGLALLAPALVLAQDAPAPIRPAEAARRVGEVVTVEMEVKSARVSGTVGFLNSEEDFRSPANFTLFLGSNALERFKKAGIADPADHFRGKTVRATGKVGLYQDRPQIALDGPAAIKLVEKAAR